MIKQNPQQRNKKVANNYLEFSEVIENLTPEEMNWWENDAENVGNENDDTVCYDFVLERDERRVWFHADECGNVEALALVVHEFLCKFRINDYFSLEWAHWCSKPLIGEFSGGAMFVTAHEVKFHNSGQWVLERQNEWNTNKEKTERTIWYNNGQGDHDDSNVGWWWSDGDGASWGPFGNRDEAEEDAQEST